MGASFLLGRFTLIGTGADGTDHRKFWECLEDGTGKYLTRWGRIGTKGQSKPGLTSWEAETKVREKTREGYRHDPDSAPSLQEETRRRLAAALPDAGLTRPARRRF